MPALSEKEKTRRWSAIQNILSEVGADALITYALPSAPAYNGFGAHLRYVTLYAPFDPSAASVFWSDGHCELIVGNPIVQREAQKASWLSDASVAPKPLEYIVDALLNKKVKKIAVADIGSWPLDTAALLYSNFEESMIVDIGDRLLSLRMLKSDEELHIVEKCCGITDQLWQRMPEMVYEGCPEYEALASFESFMRLRESDGAFNQILALPDCDYDAVPSNRIIRAGDSLMIEISTRLQGYWTQLTSIVTIGHADDYLKRAYQASLFAQREAAERMLKPGNNIQDATKLARSVVEKHGFKMPGANSGHFMGYDLTEVQVGSVPLELKPGMVLVFHPVLGDERYRWIMRADTYVITETGNRKLSTYSDDLLEIT